MPKVVIALSGGVDSSVAAALLLKQGFEVIGATMRLWSKPGCENENRCCTPQTRLIARQLCEKLGIPFYVLETSQLFREHVVQPFLEGYSRGDTPNPCIFCNRYLKWGYLLEFCDSIGAEFVATGHYARVEKNQNGNFELYRGADISKDQSYFMSLLTQVHLSRTQFPLAHYHKQEVRQIAREMDLPSAELPESQDLCFLGNRDYRSFLAQYEPRVVNPGQICDIDGRVLGTHNGLAFYTIGQRKGLPPASSAIYVLEKDVANNRLIVGPAQALGKKEMIVRNVNWIIGNPSADEFQADVKIRFKAVPAQASIKIIGNGSLRVHFLQPLRDITPGQMAVFYQKDMVLGGGIIERAM